MLNFCTLFDKNYLSKGIILWESLKTNCDSFNLYILCLDDFTFEYLNSLNYDYVIPIHLNELEEFDQDLKSVKNSRTIIEYYFTLSPCLPLFILKKNPKLKWICSLDADIYFFSNPNKLFHNFIDSYSILITPHKFTDCLKTMGYEKYGKFNVSFQAFKNNTIGLKCLEKWKLQCISWCKDYYDEEINCFADQKYLDTWLCDYKDSVLVLGDETSGLAVWNLNNYKLNFKNKILYSNNKPIIFYHFHGLQFVSSKWIINDFNIYKVNSNKTIIKHLYKPYIDSLLRINKTLNLEYQKNNRQKDITKLKKILDNKTPFYYLFDAFLWLINLRLFYRIYMKWFK
jgi:hypothetical protein